jgi:hypothetical protein
LNVPVKVGTHRFVHRLRSGRINFIGVALLLALLGATWWAITFVPLYFDNFEVRSQLEAVVLFEGVAQGSEKAMIADMTTRLSRIGSHFEIDEESGLEKEVPGIVPDEDGLEAEVTATEVRMKLTYQRRSYWKFTQKPITVKFEVEKKRSLKK